MRDAEFGQSLHEIVKRFLFYSFIHSFVSAQSGGSARDAGRERIDVNAAGADLRSSGSFHG